MRILFTACTYYQNGKLPITITTEESNKSRVKSLSCFNKVCHPFTGKTQPANQNCLYITSDVCASQFWLRYVFSLPTHIQPDIIDCHYNEAHHGKGLTGRIDVMVKNLVYHRVLSGDVVINTLREFVEFANQISSVDCLFLDKSEFIQEPEEISKATPILSTLKFHKVSRVRNGPHSFSNYYFKLSEDLESFHVQK